MHFNFASRVAQADRSAGRSRWGVLPLLVVAVFLSAGFVYGVRSYARVTEVRPALDSTVGNVKPESAIGITFLSPVRTEGFVEGIRIDPAIPVHFEWEKGNVKLLVKPDTRWVSGTQYTLSLPEGRTVWLGTVPETKLFFETWTPPRILSVSPQDGARDVLLGAEDPVVVRLSRPAKDSFFEFSFNGEGAALYEIDPEKEEFRILPSDIQSGKRYDLSVRVRHREASDASFETIFTGSFETLPPKPATWSKDFSTRLLEAKRYTEPALKTGKYIDINIESQVMVIFEEGSAIDAFLVSSGKRGMDTPEGTFSIHNKTPRAWSKTYGLYMPYWMAIVPGGKFGIHELPEWPGGYKEGANHLGTRVSHGCVRLGVGNAQRVYNWADIGTPVVIH